MAITVMLRVPSVSPQLGGMYFQSDIYHKGRIIYLVKVRTQKDKDSRIQLTNANERERKIEGEKYARLAIKIYKKRIL